MTLADWRKILDELSPPYGGYWENHPDIRSVYVTTRSAYADWLEEYGEPTADALAAQRYMAEHRKCPIPTYSKFGHKWEVGTEDYWFKLPAELFALLPRSGKRTAAGSKLRLGVFPTRAEAEWALGVALVFLSGSPVLAAEALSDYRKRRYDYNAEYEGEES